MALTNGLVLLLPCLKICKNVIHALLSIINTSYRKYGNHDGSRCRISRLFSNQCCHCITTITLLTSLVIGQVVELLLQSILPFLLSFNRHLPRKESSNTMTQEWFPILSAFLLVGASIGFTIWVAFDVPRNRKLKTRQSLMKEDSETVREDFEMEIDVDGDIEEQIRQQQRKNTKTVAVPSKATNGEDSVAALRSPTKRHSSESMLKWSNVTCVYAAKKGKKDGVALEASFGELHPGELMAIMGPR